VVDKGKQENDRFSLKKKWMALALIIASHRI
jgi:hypothetical protein